MNNFDEYEIISIILEVLESPEIKIKDGNNAYLLAKHLKNDYYFINVSVDKDGDYLISISNNDDYFINVSVDKDGDYHFKSQYTADNILPQTPNKDKDLER